MSDERDIAETMGVGAAWFARADEVGVPAPPNAAPVDVSAIPAPATTVRQRASNIAATLRDWCRERWRERWRELTALAGIAVAAAGAVVAGLAFSATSSELTLATMADETALCRNGVALFERTRNSGMKVTNMVGGPEPQSEVCKSGSHVAIVTRENNWALRWGFGLLVAGTIAQAVPLVAALRR